MTQPAPPIEPTSWKSCLAITAAGFASAVAQILTVRELLVLFYGNELSVGLVFTSWLLWTALGSSLGGRYSRRINPTEVTLALALTGLALVVPATLLWIRASRLVWFIPLGELLPPGKMLAIALTATGPLCIANGLLFALAWAVQAAGTRVPYGRSHAPPGDTCPDGLARNPGKIGWTGPLEGLDSRPAIRGDHDHVVPHPSSCKASPNDDSPPLAPVTQPAATCHSLHKRERFAGQPLLIYLGEAAGAALGGLCLYFFLLPRAAVLTTACILSLLLWVVAGVLLSWSRKALTAVELAIGCRHLPRLFGADSPGGRAGSNGFPAPGALPDRERKP